MENDGKRAVFGCLKAMAGVERRLQELETRGAAAARGLRALEPFVEQVTARCEPFRRRFQMFLIFWSRKDLLRVEKT